MKVLLDTHVFLWALMEPSRLSAKVRRLLGDPQTDISVSAATAWEIATKFRLGRLAGARNVVADYEAAISGLRASALPIRNQHAVKAGSYPHQHSDPFDRMLAAQADIEGLILVSRDPALKQFGVDLLW